MLGYETAVVNGQMVSVAPRAAFDPLIFGPAYSSGNMWPRQGVYNTPPILGTVSGTSPASPASGSYPTATGPNGNPLHPTKSPVLWVLLFLALSLFALHKVFWRKEG